MPSRAVFTNAKQLEDSRSDVAFQVRLSNAACAAAKTIHQISKRALPLEDL